MKTYTLFLILALSVFIVSCSTPKVFTDYDKEVNFKTYTSYNFYPLQTNLSLEEEDAIMGFVEANLQKKGLESQVIPKFSIDIVVEIIDVENPIVTETGYAMFNNNVPYLIMTIDFVDALTSELFWEAHVEKRVKRKLTETERLALCQEFIELALANYPPQQSNANKE